ncbi:MAG: hypothetical protein HKM02_12650 [Pseudomonadales bacterium]|nr:hypothetical protein [Pseudomonadales bacterium]
MTAYFDVKQHPFATQQGHIDLPILYYNTACVFANFMVSASAARQLLPAALEPVIIAPGRSIATVAFFQYVDSSVGPYNEMGLAVAARPSHRAGFHSTAAWHPGQSIMPGMYVVDLPVTTEIANAAGRECWGYPKIVVPIEFSRRGPQLDCQVYDADGVTSLCSLSGRTGMGLKLPAPNLMTYTQRQGTLLRTVIAMRGGMDHTRAGSVRLRISNSPHHLCEHLRVLDLDKATPLLVQSGQGLQAILPAGETVD